MIKKTIILGYEELPGQKYPVILCEERTDLILQGGMKFWCEHCKEVHRHGTGEGHRVPHCHKPDSLFAKNGYIITLNPNYFKDKEKEE